MEISTPPPRWTPVTCYLPTALAANRSLQNTCLAACPVKPFVHTALLLSITEEAFDEVRVREGSFRHAYTSKTTVSR